MWPFSSSGSGSGSASSPAQGSSLAPQPSSSHTGSLAQPSHDLITSPPSLSQHADSSSPSDHFRSSSSMLGSTELESTSSSAAAALLPPPPRFDPETLRIPLTAMGLGFVSGVFSSASRASMVFMAENAHRQPDTVQGWYFYNKTKNYKVILAGVKGGFKSGLRLGAWAVSWVALDHGIAACRRSVLFGPSPTQPPLIISLSPEPSVQLSPPATTDLAGSDVASDEGSAVLYHPHDRYMRWFDGALAGTGVASGAVLLHRLPRPTSFHFILGGLLAGGVFGGLRDLQGLIAEAKPESEASKHTSSPVVVPSPAATPINR